MNRPTLQDQLHRRDHDHHGINAQLMGVLACCLIVLVLPWLIVFWIITHWPFPWP